MFLSPYRQPEENGLKDSFGQESARVDDVDGCQLGEEGELSELPHQDEDASQKGDHKDLERHHFKRETSLSFPVGSFLLTVALLTDLGLVDDLVRLVPERDGDKVELGQTDGKREALPQGWGPLHPGALKRQG